MISIKNLSKSYNGSFNVLNGIDYEFENTGLYFLIGKSGSGKTTFLQLVGGMDYEYEGSINVDGQELKEMSGKEKEDYLLKKIAFVFQDFKAEDNEKVYDNLEKGLLVTNMKKNERKKRIHEILEKVGLKDKENSRFSELSGGEKKRISLARALLKDTPILLADEPLASLNSSIRKSIYSILREESRKRLVIVITHERDSLEDCNVLELVDGRFEQIKTCENEGHPIENIERKKLNTFDYFKTVFKSFLSKKDYVLVNLLSLMISLFTLIFSFQLSGSVSSSLEETMSSYMETNTMVVGKADDGYTSSSLEEASYSKLTLLKNRYPEYVESVSTFYTSSLDTIFGSNQSVKLQYGHKSFEVSKLSMNSFIGARTPSESAKYMELSNRVEEYGEDEITMALDNDAMNTLYRLMYNESAPYGVDTEIVETMRSSLKGRLITVLVYANKSEWSYYFEMSFTLKDVVLDDSCYIISGPDFASDFADLIHFDQIGEGEMSENPWVIEKCFGLRLYPGCNGEFLEEFLFDSAFEDYTMEIIKCQGYYQENNPDTYNRIGIYSDLTSRLSLSSVRSFAANNSSLVECVSYSSSVYTYTASGYISGFQKPFFFARRKELLNNIQDEFHSSDEDLGLFQGTLIDVEDGVYKADLLSSTEEEGLTFVSTDYNPISPILGRECSSFNEIAISSKMAENLFSSKEYALGETLHVLTLTDTNYSSGKYINEFFEGELEIVGIYESDEIKIYQSSLFPLCYCFENTFVDALDLRVTEAVVKVDLETHDTSYYEDLVTQYGSFEVSFPMLSVTESIQDTMDQLSMMFLLFSLIGLVTSLFLLSLSMFLLVKKDRKQIGIKLSMGYRKDEILNEYFLFFAIISAVGYILACILSSVAEVVMADTLSSMLSAYTFSIYPFVIGFFVTFAVLFVSLIPLKIFLKSMSPRDAFLK